MTISEKLAFLKEGFEKRQILQRESKGIEEVELLKEMTKITEEVYGSTSNQTINILNELGGSAKYIGEYELAIESITRAKDILADKFSKDSIPYATTCLNLAEVYRFANKFDEIEKMYLEVIRVYKANDMENSYEYAGVCNNLGLFYQDTNNANEALKLHLISYDILKDMQDSKIAFATTLNNLGVVYRTLGDIEKSLELFNKSLVICKDSFGENSRSYQNLIENIKVVKETMEMRNKK